MPHRSFVKPEVIEAWRKLNEKHEHREHEFVLCLPYSRVACVQPSLSAS